MSDDGENSLFGELKRNFLYMFQSAKGKYSLSTYIDILSEFTDSTINEARKKNLHYKDGELIFKDQDDNKINVLINMNFIDNNNADIQKKAERNLEKKIFTSEAITKIEQEEEIHYSIEAPKER
jgi:hypothetical protein